MSRDLAGWRSLYPSPTFTNLPALEVHAVRPTRRVLPNGEVRTDLVIIATQRRRGYASVESQTFIDKGHVPPAGDGDFMFRGGCTLLVDLETGDVRHIIRKDILDEQRLSDQREYWLHDLTPGLQGVYFGQRGQRRAEELPEPFAFLHRLPATDHVTS